MTEEQKKEECKCDCCRLAAKFLFLTASIFIGVLLAIVFAAHLLKPPVPPCPCHRGMHGMPPRMERQMPPAPPEGFFQEDVKIYRVEDGMPPQGIKKASRRDFKNGHPDFKKGHFSQRGERPQAPAEPERK